MRLHPHAAGLFAILDPDWRRKIFAGGLLLLVAPPFGWPAILGYRKALVEHLFEDLPDALPAWKGMRLHYFAEGLKAIGVIFGYFLPLYAALALIVVPRGWVPGAYSGLMLLFFLVFPIFSTLSFPLACGLFAFASTPGWISPVELGVLLLAFAAVTFLVPAGFLRVSETGRYRSAFALWRTLPIVAREPGAYVGAWWYSGVMSLFGHLALPFSPWGVAWCYLGIMFLFNEILHHGGRSPGAGWLARALDDERLAANRGLGVRRLEDGGGTEVLVLDVRLFSVPLPRCVSDRMGRRGRRTPSEGGGSRSPREE